MAALIRWNEYNGAGCVETVGIQNLNFGVHDAPNLNPASSVIDRGTASFDKWVKIEFYGGSFNRVSEFRFWRSDGQGGDGPALPAGVSVRAEAGVEGDLVYQAPSREVRVSQECPASRGSALVVGPAELTGYGKTYFIHLQAVTTEEAPTGDVVLGYFTFEWKEE